MKETIPKSWAADGSGMLDDLDVLCSILSSCMPTTCALPVNTLCKVGRSQRKCVKLLSTLSGDNGNRDACNVLQMDWHFRSNGTRNKKNKCHASCFVKHYSDNPRRQHLDFSWAKNTKQKNLAEEGFFSCMLHSHVHLSTVDTAQCCALL